LHLNARFERARLDRNVHAKGAPARRGGGFKGTYGGARRIGHLLEAAELGLRCLGEPIGFARCVFDRGGERIVNRLVGVGEAKVDTREMSRSRTCTVLLA
jgi:hypothetical protein